MAIKKIKVLGDPCLYIAAKKVDPITIKEDIIQQVITDLIDTLQDVGGVGIAAPQIGVPLRIIIINIEECRANTEKCSPMQFEAHINPSILKAEGRVEKMEACLSLPGLAGIVPRSEHIIYKFYDRYGKKKVCDFHHFPARVIQHEMDHLDGKLYLSRIDNPSKFGFIEHFLNKEELATKKHLIESQRAILFNILE